MGRAKQALLLVRLFVEAVFGLICITALLLLPEIWRGLFPQILIIGFLGMPRRGQFQGFSAVAMLAGFLGVTIAVVSSALYFRDVFRINRKLRAIRHESWR